MLTRSLRILGLLMAGGLLALFAVFVLYLNDQPDLKLWHQVVLDQEFTAGSDIDTLADYLALEDRLFAQLESEVYDRVGLADQRLFNRYYRDSLSHPSRWTRNWNRSFELPVDRPVAGVLLLHGMSDAPYSLRSQGERLHAAGAWVLGLRLPGHGTVPSALTSATWQDMAAAVRLGMQHLRARVGDRPIVIVGYSNGGALGVHYALTALTDTALPSPARIVLISPAIGVTPLAALAVWQGRVGGLLGLDKLRWNSVGIEYNPFKYESFAVNAGDQTRRLTVEISRLLERLGARGELAAFPPVLAFQSAVDATVSTPALITGLMSKLPDHGHELVVFDVDRRTEVEYLLTDDPKARLLPLVESRERPFTLSVLTNASPDSKALVLLRHRPGEGVVERMALDLRWPRDLYSLSHVALPFPPDDPLYGRGDGPPVGHIQIGAAALRGERGALAISATDMLRLNWNPFYGWMEDRMFEFLGWEQAPASGAGGASEAGR